MKKSYHNSVPLRCIACGESSFEYNDDKSWVKCTRCGREYNGGYDELVELNQSAISEELEKTKKEVLKDVAKELKDSIRKAFKNNPNVKFK